MHTTVPLMIISINESVALIRTLTTHTRPILINVLALDAILNRCDHPADSAEKRVQVTRQPLIETEQECTRSCNRNLDSATQMHLNTIIKDRD